MSEESQNHDAEVRKAIRDKKLEKNKDLPINEEKSLNCLIKTRTAYKQGEV